MGEGADSRRRQSGQHIHPRAKYSPKTDLIRVGGDVVELVPAQVPKNKHIRACCHLRVQLYQNQSEQSRQYEVDFVTIRAIAVLSPCHLSPSTQRLDRTRCRQDCLQTHTTRWCKVWFKRHWDLIRRDRSYNLQRG